MNSTATFSALSLDSKARAFLFLVGSGKEAEQIPRGLWPYMRELEVRGLIRVSESFAHSRVIRVGARFRFAKAVPAFVWVEPTAYGLSAAGL